MMSFKKGIVAIASLVLFSQVANAQYMSVGEMSITDAYKGKVLKNAIDSENYQVVDDWVKSNGGFTIPYDNKNVCISYIQHVEQVKPLSDKNTPERQALYLGQNNLNAYFSECDLIPIPSLLARTNVIHSPTHIRLFPAKHYYDNDKKSIESYKKKIEYANKFLEHLAPNQWEQLIPIIENTQIDYAFRLKAFKKLNELYPLRMKTASPQQKAYWEAAEKAEKENPSYSVDFGNYDRMTSPYNYLIKKVARNLAGYSSSLADRYASFPEGKEKVSDYLTKDYFLGNKKVGVQDIKNMKLDDLGYMNQIALNVWQEAEILKILLDSRNTDLNKQNPMGNNILHHMLDKNLTQFNGNKVLANFYRSLLERGVDPNALNTSKQTPYMIFQEKYAGSDGLKDLFDAFALKEYK